ncbi:Hypothetical protein SMAX5B_002808 [Scophthalmus maximus]|uniref:Uncharacterized protein n=1 Tax=Scophthalmus maximus TaxID=52904 RepID=A0A2U9BF58_SCOMX|nr:Hypothetical protein SMAX5B_002808 [Scophthalmus maximus]
MSPHVHVCCCSYVVQIGGRQLELKGCQHVCVKSFLLDLDPDVDPSLQKMHSPVAMPETYL